MAKEKNELELKKPKIRIYSDGSVKGMSDGPGGYGVIVQFMTDDNKTDHIIEHTEGFKVTTNNRMELMGVICGLESLTQPSDVTVYSDSKYVVDAFNHRWINNWMSNGWMTANKQPVKNIDLWKRLLEAKKPHDCKFAWIKGHDGHVDNERCDYLAQSSADGIKFERNKNGILEPVKAVLSEDTGLSKEDMEKPKISLNSIVKEYIDQMGKDLVGYTTTINGAKFVCDEEGNLAPHPDEDPEKCAKVLKELNEFFKDEKMSKAFEDFLNPNFINPDIDKIFNEVFSTTLWTGNNTIPKIEIQKGDDK